MFDIYLNMFLSSSIFLYFVCLLYVCVFVYLYVLFTCFDCFVACAVECAEAMATVVKEEDPKHIGACKHDKNARRDVISKMAKHSKHAPLYSSKITLWDEQNSRPIKDDAYFLLIHEELDHMYADVPPGDHCEVAPGARWKRV